MQPGDFTLRFVVTLGGDLTIYCTTCREGRGTNLAGPRFAHRLDQPVAAMRFRCGRCGEPGAAVVSWHDSEGRWSYDYSTGRKRSVDNPSIYNR